MTFQDFPLLTITVDQIVHLRSEACERLDASQLTSQAKHHAKDILGGSLYLVEAEPVGCLV
jgi:hypothetical protein